MRQIIVTEFLSLDGVMEAPHEWHFPFFDDGAGNYKEDELANTGALLLGRTTYEGFAAAWPERGEDMAGKPEPTDRESESHFTDRFNWLPKYVVSDTLTEAELTWNKSHIIRGKETAERLQQLKQEGDKDIVIHGSGRLINSLIPMGLIDKWHLMVHPIVVGKGQRLFPDGLPETALSLVDVKTYDKGIVVLEYATDRSAS